MTAVLMAALVLGSGLPAEEPSAVIEGTATWLCDPPRWPRCTVGYPEGSMVAAAGPGLRFDGWRGSLVTVRHRGKSVVVRLVDWCACPGGRVIDLYAKPFSMLAPLSRGVIAVTVEIGGSVARQTLPPTSTDPWAGLWSRRL